MDAKIDKPDKVNLDTCSNVYDPKCGKNKELLQEEKENMIEEQQHPNTDPFLYPDLNDPNFNIKIANKKEFSNAKYDGTIANVETRAAELSQVEYELLPQQAFVRNFMSFQTPYNSLLLFHGLGSGKTCSAIGVCEEMRDYLKQMGISKRIIIVASPNVQDNFKLQLFDERKLKEVDGIWTIKGCLGNKLLKEINPTGMKGLKREKVIQLVKHIISSAYYFVGYTQFSNDIVRNQGTIDLPEVKRRNLENEYSDRLIVVDEVHNIRISDDNENKNVAKNLMYLVSIVSNLRLLLLSATPMFNSYKEIVWLLNLMNMNDRRGIVGISDIFDTNTGELTVEGEKLLIRKANGYVSYVRGENPYTFPFRVYPNKFAPENSFKQLVIVNKEEPVLLSEEQEQIDKEDQEQIDKEEDLIPENSLLGEQTYPKYNLNGQPIDDNKKINKLQLFVTHIGKVQKMGYRYIMNNLLSREARTTTTKTGQRRLQKAFKELKAFGYTDLMLPIQALNIIYPHDGLVELEPIDYSNRLTEQEENIDDISLFPVKHDTVDVIEEMENSIVTGPVFTLEKDVIEGDNEEEEGQNLAEEEEEEAEAEQNLEEVIPIIKKTKTIKTTTRKAKKPLQTQVEQVLGEQVLGEHIVEGDTMSRVETVKNAVPVLEKAEGQVEEEEVVGGGRGRPRKVPIAAEALAEVQALEVAPLEKSLNPKYINPKYINPKELTGVEGLKSIMNYEDSKTPSVKGSFEYKPGKPHIFEQKEIGDYSSKISNVCKYIYGNTNNSNNNNNSKEKVVSDGIILIYSSYIDAGLIPMALALEEMGFTRYKGKSLFKKPRPVVDVRTMGPPKNKRDFKPASYIMITGDPRLSPNNDADVKAVTSDENIFDKDEKNNKEVKEDVSGQMIKVVLISQAGSEGLDFKAIRQIHILDPWYNVNRLEQIIGRGVRNFSHKDLPFLKRNVQIFLYGTLLNTSEEAISNPEEAINNSEEAVDLYVYRISEIKAVKIGKVTRLLKQVSVDCEINHEQSELTAVKMAEENPDIEQLLSNHKLLEHFEVGDLPNSATCDYGKCEYQCMPNLAEEPEELQVKDSPFNLNTYNETFMLINSDKIIQKIKSLFSGSNTLDGRFFYTKKTLMYLIKQQRNYPTDQIHAALTQLINDNSEYIIDKYGRTGHLINIGEYYLFQPSELNYPNISVFDRSRPLDYKHDVIKFEIKTGIINTEISAGKKVLANMYKNYNIAWKTWNVDKGTDDWYQHCGVVIRKMSKETIIKLPPLEPSSQRTKEEEEPAYRRLNLLLDTFVVQHIVDSLQMQERIDLMNYLLQNNNLANETKDNLLKVVITNINKYLQTKVIPVNKVKGMIIFDGPSKRPKELVSDNDKDNGNLNLFVIRDGKWVPGEAEDKRDFKSTIVADYELTKAEKDKMNNYVGFIGFETNQKDMVFKIKDMTNKRSTGYRCTQAGKIKKDKDKKNKGIIVILNELEEVRFKLDEIDKIKKFIPRFSGESNESVFELCIRIELTLRSYENEKLNDKTWFIDTETAIFNEFEKREKVSK